MVPRHAQATIESLCRGYPIVTVTGPRQSGKTTLVRHIFGDRAYVSLENPDERDRADHDPRGFLARYPDGAVFDEVQRCPQLLSYLQQIVDTDPKPGRFILTGSQQFGLLSGITQSLAGRVALVRLLPFELGEIHPGPPLPPDLDEVLFKGLYPPIHDRHLAPGPWYDNYIETYIERDVRQMVNVRDLVTFRRFLRLCAGRAGQLLNLSALASDCGITHNTARAWISILEASYIIFLLAPHPRNFSKRLIKTPKLYFYDGGLCARLLAIPEAGQLGIHSLRGALFESFVIAEILKSRCHRGLPRDLYFWRDRSGNEVDLIVENGETLQPVEIKSGMTLNREFFKGLENWMAMAGAAAASPVLVFGGQSSGQRSGVTILSWNDPRLVQVPIG